MTNDISTTYAPPGDGPDGRNRQPGGGARTPLRVLVVLISIAAIVWGAITLASLMGRGHGQANGTYSGIRTVQVDLGFEAVDIVGSPDATEVSMRRTYHWSLNEPEVSTSKEGDVLRVSSSCSWEIGIGCTGRVTLEVPEDIALRMDVSDGSATIRDLTGDLDLESTDGSIDASHLTGRLSIRTSDGSVTATGLRSDTVDVATTDGSVHLDFDVAPTALTARTSDGSIEIAVPDDDTAYAVSGKTSDGGRDIQVPTDPDATHAIDVTTADGSVKVTDSP
jgi:hypothetical protein